MANESEIVNILLLGETGVGKSTAINALATYLRYDELSDAANSSLLSLVPTKFSLHDTDLEEKIIEVGKSPNEINEGGKSSTQNIQSYLLKYGETNIRLIDTPGIGDTRGIAYDEENTERLLTFIGELHHLNAICILLKPNNSRISVLFDYCLKHILLRLDKGIQSNIVFLFTNARSSFYTPGDTYIPLKALLTQSTLRKFSIPFNSSNVFCVDNESYRYLAAKSKGFVFDQEDVQEFEQSWTKSSNAYKRMLDHILSLPSAPMQGTISINESRRLIGRLGKSIVQLLVLHEKAINVLKIHEAALLANKDSLSDLQSKLYIPVTRYITSQKSWSKSYDSGGFKSSLNFSWSYPFVSWDLEYEHTITHASYTEMNMASYVTMEQDAGLKDAIKTKNEALEVIAKIVDTMNELKEKYKNESEVILQAATRFTVFLHENAILSAGDAFDNYLGQLMRYESVTENDDKLIEALENGIVRYRKIKNKTRNVTPADIEESKMKLINLEYSGPIFKEVIEKQLPIVDKKLDT